MDVCFNGSLMYKMRFELNVLFVLVRLDPPKKSPDHPGHMKIWIGNVLAAMWKGLSRTMKRHAPNAVKFNITTLLSPENHLEMCIP